MHHAPRFAALVAALTLAAACGREAPGPAPAPARPAVASAAPKASPAPAAAPAPESAEDLEAVIHEFAKKQRALVQVALPPDAPRVRFAARLVDGGRILASVPEGWKPGLNPGRFDPPEKEMLGFATRYTVATDCNGICEPKDWPAVMVSDVLTAFDDTDHYEILARVDLTDPPGKRLTARSKDNDLVHVLATRWKEGLDRYYLCRANLDGERAHLLLPAFEKACDTNIPRFIE